MKQSHIHFSKMHGLGNDFLVINALSKKITIPTTKIQSLANRHIGVGFDQLLIIEPSNKADAFCRIFNADGSEARQCGNGLRCIARYLHENEIIKTNHLQIETLAGIFPIQIENYQHIAVNLGSPIVKEKSLHLIVNQQKMEFCWIELGNPHVIMKVDSFEHFPFERFATDISNSPTFKDGINIGFMQVITPTHIRLRTYERGAGFTYACGSNASAALMAGIVNGWLEDHVQVDYQYGSLKVKWIKETNAVQLTGPAEIVYFGSLSL